MIALLRSARASALVRTTGAALERFDVDGVMVIGAEPPPPADAYPGSVLAPWPNRLLGGTWFHEGIEYRVPINEPARNAALHGLVAFREWEIEDRSDDAVTLRIGLGADPGYPFDVRLRARYRLAGNAIEATIEAHNGGSVAVPVGLGAHPYLAVPGGVDEALLDGRSLRGVTLDDAVGDLERDEDGRARATIDRPEGRIEIWAGPTCRWFMVFTADTLPPPWARAVLAVEPMTCAPDALRTGPIDIVEPGERLALEWGATFSPVDQRGAPTSSA